MNEIVNTCIYEWTKNNWVLKWLISYMNKGMNEYTNVQMNE